MRSITERVVAKCSYSSGPSSVAMVDCWLLLKMGGQRMVHHDFMVGDGFVEHAEAASNLMEFTNRLYISLLGNMPYPTHMDDPFDDRHKVGDLLIGAYEQLLSLQPEVKLLSTRRGAIQVVDLYRRVPYSAPTPVKVAVLSEGLITLTLLNCFPKIVECMWAALPKLEHLVEVVDGGATLASLKVEAKRAHATLKVQMCSY